MIVDLELIMTKMCLYQPRPMSGFVSSETAMSHAIAKFFGESTYSRFAEVCRQRAATAAVVLSILFLAVIVMTL